MRSIFVSYSEERDSPFVESLGSALKPLGIQVIDGRIRRKLESDIYSALLQSDSVIAIIGGQSSTVDIDVGYAMGSGKLLLLVCKTTADLPNDLAGIHSIRSDLSDPDLVPEVIRRIEQMDIGGAAGAREDRATADRLVAYRSDRPAFDAMDPARFEELVADLFHKRGFRVSSPGEGFDFLAEDPEGRDVAVEVKKRQSNRPVSVREVRELIGAAGSLGAPRAILVSTSGFTASARDLASGSEFDVSLWNMDDLLDLEPRFRRTSTMRRGEAGPALFVPDLFGSQLRLAGDPLWTDLRSIRSTLREPHKLLDPHVEAFDVLQDVGFKFALPFKVGLSLKVRGAPVYRPLLEALKQQRRSVWTFPYNWTRSVVEVALELDRWFEGRLDAGVPRDGWVLIGHGLGGLVVSAFLSMRRRTAVGIDRAVFVGVPFRGSTRALGMLCGMESGLGWSPHGDPEVDAMSKRNLREVLLRSPALHDLLPPSSERIIYDDAMRLHRLADLPELLPTSFRDDWEEATQAVEAARAATDFPLHADVASALSTTDGPDITVIYSGSHDTPSKIEIDEQGVMRYATTDAGDGVVTVGSATGELAPDQVFPVDREHADLTSSAPFLEWIENETVKRTL